MCRQDSLTKYSNKPQTEPLIKPLTTSPTLQLKRAFRAYDKGGAGSVKITEMRGLLSDLGVVMLESEMNDYLDQVAHADVC